MNKILLQISIVLVFAGNISAKHLSEKDVLSAAENWLKLYESFLHYGKLNALSGRFYIKSIKAIVDDSNNTVLYVAELNPIGFILFSTDDRLKPVIGYSSENNFNFKNYSSDVFLNTVIYDLNKILGRIKNEADNRSAILINISEWETLIENSSVLTSSKEISDIYGPFLNSDWGQGYVNGYPVYNYYTPNRWPAGCVATATAQILNYYRWPLQGVGQHGYYDNGQYLSADFGNTFYDWENTLDLYTNQSFTLDNQKAAGILTYHPAVALEMDFEADGSTASTTDVPAVLQNYFRASGHYKSESSPGFWDEMKNNMLDERPAIISIKSTSHSVGHAAVVDGYFETNNYYHVNPGWYGDNTGWYDISGSWNMGSYDIVVGAAKGIVPSPMINDNEQISDNSFILSWSTSRNQKAEMYELEESRELIGPWTTLSNSLTDTTYQIDDADQSAYYYRVRVKRDSIWWNYSEVKKVQLGTERQVTFQVNMSYRELAEGESVVIRGNTPPLAGNINSEPMIGPDSNNVYTLSINFDYDYVGTNLLYRYFIDSPEGLIPESSNREYVITSDSIQIIPPVYFDDVVSVDENDKTIPADFILEQNYPNPFGKAILSGNTSTIISYSISLSSVIPNSFRDLGDFSSQAPRNDKVHVTLKVYNSLGQEIKILVDKEQPAGNYKFRFNADHLAAGIYYYQLTVDSFVETKKMILLR